MKKKLLCALLSVCMITALMPLSAFANVSDEPAAGIEAEPITDGIPGANDGDRSFSENAAEEIDARETKVLSDAHVISSNGVIADSLSDPEPDLSEAEDTNVKVNDDTEKPVVLKTDEEIDVDFEIRENPVALSSDEKNLFDCGTDYAYRDFLLRSNPEDRRSFYDKLLEINKAFSTDTQNVPETEMGYIISEIDISAMSLTSDELAEVYYMFRQDHPEFYWMSNAITIYGAEKFYAPIYSDYADGGVRADLSNTMSENIKAYADIIGGETSAYEIALALHDEIIDDAEYGYDQNGEPLDTPYAHNIVGILDGDAETDVVCESYAKTYQLLLNYFGVENILITGFAGEDHSWNAVKLDNNSWYQADLTWDDRPFYPKGCAYDYFATDSSNWADRTINGSDGTGIKFQYDLPELSSEEFVPDDFVGDVVGTTWEEEFRKDESFESFSDSDYSAYFTVKVNNSRRKEVWITVTGHYSTKSIDIPETIVHNGVTYSVTGSRADLDYIFGPYIFCEYVTEIHLPESMEYIDSILLSVSPELERINIPKAARFFSNNSMMENLNNIDLEDGNPYFTKENGVLYSADMSRIYIMERNARCDSIDIPETVKSISPYAFSCVNNLKSVKLGKNLECIPMGLLYNCKSLTSVDIPNGITSIESNAFYGCVSLSDELVMPDSVTDVGENIISGTSLKKLHLSSNINVLYSNSLICDTIREFSMNDGGNSVFYCDDGVLCADYTDIGYGKRIVFYPTDRSVDEYTIPSDITDVESYAFHHAMIKRINVHKNFIGVRDEMYEMACFQDSGVEYISIDDDNPYAWSDEYGVVFNRDKTRLLYYPPNRSVDSYRIPDGVKYVGDFAFYSPLHSPREVVFPDSVVEIGDNAFSFNYELESVKVNDGLQRICIWAFADCTALTEFIMPDSVTEVGAGNKFTFFGKLGIFDGCENLTYVKLSENLAELPAQMFSGCQSLEKLTIPAGVKEIERNVFPTCDCIELIFMGDCPKINDDSQIGSADIIYYYEGHTGFENYYSWSYKLVKLKAGNTPESVIEDPLEYITFNELPDGTLEAASCRTDVYGTLTVPGEVNGVKVSRIGDNFAGNCKALRKLIISSGIAEIGSNINFWCMFMNEVFIPETVKEIHMPSFWMYYDGIEDGLDLFINVDENNPNFSSVDGVLFNKDKSEIIAYRKKASEYRVPDGVEIIGDNAFDGAMLNRIILSNGVKEIGCYALEASGLEAVEIPKSVLLIANLAFGSGLNLKDIYYAGTEDEWNAIERYENSNYGLENVTIHYEETMPTPEPTAEPSYSPDPTQEPDPTPTPTLKPIPTPVVTESPTETPEPTATAAPTESPTETPEPTATAAPTESPTETPEPTATAAPTTAPAPTATPITEPPATDVPATAAPTIPPTAAPTAAPATEAPTSTPTPMPTAVPTDTPEPTKVPVVLNGIRIKSAPKNSNVTEGLPLNIDGLVVEGIYSDGTFEEITDYTLSGFDPSKLGMQNVTVEYNGFTTSFSVYVEAKKLIGISVTQKPDKRAYIQGEVLDTSGMIVTALYNNDTSEEIKDYTVSGYDPNYAGSQTISVSYSGFSATFTVTVSAKEQTSGTAETPKISISSFIGGKTVTLTCATEGAAIYYTDDGSAPSDSSTLYTGPITLSETKTIKAIAVKSGAENSKIASGKITVAETEKPSASHNAGQLETGTVITLKSPTSGAMIYYTTDGSEPSVESKRYSGGIAITSNVTIKAIAVKSGNTNSDVFEISYTVPEIEKGSASVSLGSVTGTAGDNISVPVYIFTEEKITDYRLTINYDADKFEYQSVTPAEGAEASDLFTSAGDGKVTVLYSGAAIESGEVCDINLKALESDEDGEYPISIQKDSVKIETGTGNKYNIDITDGIITLIGSNNSNLELRSDVMLTDPNGNDITEKHEATGRVTANVTLENANEEAAIEPMTVNIIMAVYDQNDCLVSMSVMDADLSDLNYVFTNTIDIPKGVEVGSIKLMVWNGLSEMTPMSAASEIL